MTKDIFNSPSLQSRFRSEGYVIVPLLGAREISRLAEIFHNQEGGSNVGLPFYTSIWSENSSYRESVDADIKKILTPALNAYLNDCKPVFANFMVKQPGENSSLIPHQDWNFVDETKYDSATVWCPLVDVDAVNGNLQVVPRSHRLENLIRGRFFDAPFAKLKAEDIAAMLKNLPMKAGEALIMNSRLIHASPPNRSSAVRVAASVVMAPAEAGLIHYVLDAREKNTYKKLHINTGFFTDYSCYDLLDSIKSDENFPYRHTAMTKEDLLALIG